MCRMLHPFICLIVAGLFVSGCNRVPSDDDASRPIPSRPPSRPQRRAIPTTSPTRTSRGWPLASPASAIYIDREVAKRRRKPVRKRELLTAGRKRVLVVLFIPSVERDGATPIDQDRWVDAALEMLGRLFGGATGYPKAKGIWRDDERAGALVKDDPVVVHCYTTPSDIEDSKNLAALGSFCRTMGRDARQGEIGLVIGEEYFAIREFNEE